MKTVLSLAAVLALVHKAAACDTKICDIGNIDLSDAEEAAAAIDCTKIIGDVKISSDVKNATLCLEEITGDFKLKDTESFVELSHTDHFPELTTVGGDFIVSGNSALVEVQLGPLDSVGGNMKFKDNAAIEAFSFDSLDAVGKDFEVSDNAALEAFENQVANVGGNVLVKDNPEMLEYNMDGLSTVGKDLEFTNNPKLDVIGFQKTTVGKNVKFTDMALLEEIQGDITSIGEDLLVKDLPIIKQISFSTSAVGDDATFENLEDVTDMDIGQLAEVGGTLKIKDLDALYEVNVNSLLDADKIDIVDNKDLHTLKATSLTTVGTLNVKNNPLLQIVNQVNPTGTIGELTLDLGNGIEIKDTDQLASWQDANAVPL